MAPLNPAEALVRAMLCGGALLTLGCSPEATRVRDGGPGADPGNKPLVEARHVNPHAADTTLWPGRAPAPVDRLAAGTMPPPPAAPTARTPSKPEQRAFTKSAKDPTTRPEPR